MAVRNDVHVEWWRSPRIIVIETPSTSIEIQDLVDTLRVIESELLSVDDDSLLDAAGKQTLSGSVKVGITVVLNNAQLSFESRTTEISSGTATAIGSTDGLPGLILTDTSATFITDGVEKGDTVINITDMSIASVINIIDQTHLKTYNLQSGNENDWDINDTYQIFKAVVCTITGGNLVAVDSGNNPISTICPSAFTNTTVELSTSAALAVTGSGVTEQDKLDIADRVWDEGESSHSGVGSMGSLMTLLRKITSNKVTKVGNIITIYEDNGTNIWRQYDLSSGGRVLV